MEPSRKRAEFTVEIRRKNINHALDALRSMVHSQTPQGRITEDYTNLYEMICEGKLSFKEKLS